VGIDQARQRDAAAAVDARRVGHLARLGRDLCNVAVLDDDARRRAQNAATAVKRPHVVD